MSEVISKNSFAKLVYNNKEQKLKVLNELISNLQGCNEFSFSVAFINDHGLQCIKQPIFDLAKKGIHGRLITSTYLGFNTPKTFRELLKFDNVEVRIFNDEGFHPKGYLFKKENERKIIIGSSNITDSALTKNQEWNISLSSAFNENIVKRTENEFEDQWLNSTRLTEKWIENYEKDYKSITLPSFANKEKKEELKPNSMQIAALDSLDSLRNIGKRKALLISATGTGKTYLSAFDVKHFDAKRVLFVVHRENIAKKALESFRNIMPNKRYGLFSGNQKDADADYIFSTIQTIGKEDYLNTFDKYYFDYIVIDEVHHLGAESYQKLFNYFKPKFMLGMTATPDRTDGYDIYKDFDYNIAYEISLQQAMEEDLLCPFHYFGISDAEINGEKINDLSSLNNLTCEERVKHIIRAANKYSYSGKKVHGLIFVSRVEEARKISSILNTNGFRTEAIVGESNDVEKSIDLLESEDSDYFDYLVCVDKFNEGIDIPKVNQVIMARPTNSAIIFVQQLGRGLRKAEGKEYTVIIDLIGNYKKNYLIPIALSGNRTYNADAINEYMISGKQFLPGSSTVCFDEISRNQIFSSIEKMQNLNDVIRNSYKNLQFKIGRRPYLLDFYNEKEVDPMLIVHRFKSYYNLANSISEGLPEFDDSKKKNLEYLSKTVLDGKRCFELAILDLMLKNKKMNVSELYDSVNKVSKCSKQEFNSSINLLLCGFEQKDEVIERNKEQFSMLVLEEQLVKLTENFKNRLLDEEFEKEINDIIEVGFKYYYDNNSIITNDYPFIVNNKYSRRDVARLMNSLKDISSTMYGMHSFNGDTCIFVTYNKQDPKDEKNYVEGKPDYSDSFIDESTFEWMTRIGCGLDGEYYKEVKESKTIRLFIQKNTNELDFYYMGKVSIIGEQEKLKKDNNEKMRKIVEVIFLLDTPVSKELFDYFNNYEIKQSSN